MDGRSYSCFEFPVTSTTGMSIHSADTISDISLLDLWSFRKPTLLYDVVHSRSRPFADVHQEGLKYPVIPIRPSCSLCRTTFIKFIESSRRGYEIVRPVAIRQIPHDDVTPASLSLIRDWPQEGLSTGVSSGHSHQPTRAAPVHSTSSNLLAPSTLPLISCGKIVVPDKDRGVPKRPHLLKRTAETDPAAALLRTSPGLGPSEKPGASQRRYSCSICKLDYAQPQGLTRHQYERHKARLCIFCREFTWGRPYLFRKHLVKQHPDIDPDAAIDEATRTRRRAKIGRGYPPLPQVPIPTPECDGLGLAEFPSHPSQITSPLPRPSSLTRLSPVFLPEMAYDLRSESTGSANKEIHEQGDALLSEFFNANDGRAASPSTGEHAQADANLDMFAQTVQMWFKDKKELPNPVGFAAVNNLAPVSALAPIPTSSLLLNGYNGSPVVVSPIVERAEQVFLPSSAGLSRGTIQTNAFAFAPAPYRV